ncbi:MAG: hypothetical protein ACI4ML_06670 [Aristaeellaceae bacterium]
MERRAVVSAMAALGAVVGAGFASGREIDSFFSRCGSWSWLGVAAAAAVTGVIALGVMRRPGRGGMPDAWQGRWPGRLWQGMFGALLMCTGGAMLAGAGEIAALMLPVQGAYIMGLAGTAALTVLLARQGAEGAGAAGKALTALLLLMAGAGFLLPPRKAAVIAPAASPWESLLRGASYAGFNMALAVPGLASAAPDMSRRARRQCALLLAALLGLLLIGGNGLLMRHSALRGETMPFIHLLTAYGRAGYVLGGSAMYLAVLTTACASLRGLWTLGGGRRWRGIAALGMLACAGAGFTGTVGKAYPVLGAGCLVLLCAAIFQEK